jgi:hypothetical protein
VLDRDYGNDAACRAQVFRECVTKLGLPKVGTTPRGR